MVHNKDVEFPKIQYCQQDVTSIKIKGIKLKYSGHMGNSWLIFLHDQCPNMMGVKVHLVKIHSSNIHKG